MYCEIRQVIIEKIGTFLLAPKLFNLVQNKNVYSYVSKFILHFSADSFIDAVPSEFVFAIDNYD